VASGVKGPPPPPTGRGTGVPTRPTPELRARNAAGKQARSAPKVEHRPPRRVNTEAEEAAAFERHHRALLEDEAARHAMIESVLETQRQLDEEKDDTRIKGLNFDEERKKRGKQQRDQEEPEEGDGEAAAHAAQVAASHGLASADGAGKYFQDVPLDRLGDLTLTDPLEMKRLLGPSVRFAQHAMVLAEARLKETGDRAEAVRYLASIYQSMPDRAYAQKALREFGPATGIIDLYPLEVLDHLLAHVPSFFQKVKEARFVSASAGAYRARAGEPIALAFDPELRIRGFAIRGGARPGYLLEPTDPPGSYRMIFLSAGRFEVMMSAITRDGWVLLDRFAAEIAPGDPEVLSRLTSLERARAADPEPEPAPATAEAAPAPATPPEAGPEKKGKKDDLTFHFPRRI
jgi:hypothetical protein